MATGLQKSTLQLLIMKKLIKKVVNVKNASIPLFVQKTRGAIK